MDGDYALSSAIKDYYFGNNDWYELREDLEETMDFVLGYEGWEEGFAVLANFYEADETDLANIELEI